MRGTGLPGMILTLVLAPLRALAQEVAPDPDPGTGAETETRSEAEDDVPPTPVAPRFNPIGTIRVSFLTGLPDLFGISGSLTALRPIEIEAGVSTLLLAWSGYVRGGPVLMLSENRDHFGRGHSLSIPALAGFRYLVTGVQGGSRVTEFFGLSVTTGIDAVIWIAPHFGLDLQLVLGGVYWFETNPPDRTGGGPFFPDARLTAGLAF